MELLTNYSLKSLNTFNINVDGNYYTEVASVDEIGEALDFVKSKNIPLLILGGGSNMLFTRDYPGLVMHNRMMGREVTSDAAGEVVVRSGAGENWDDFVAFCVRHGYGGLENLSLIPGLVGASPVQNIGAYGVEMKDHFESLEYYDFNTRKVHVYGAADCRFGYRDSVFKQEKKGRGVVISVTFRLRTDPVFETSYGAIREELNQMGAGQLSLEALRSAVIRIRQSKLPDPAVIGNGGSFFKNPTVDEGQFKVLIEKFPTLVSYPQAGNRYKLAAGWLIDQCGWKGYREGDAGVHERQALVLVNHGKASGQQLFDLSQKIQSSVIKKFGVELEREINVI